MYTHNVREKNHQLNSNSNHLCLITTTYLKLPEENPKRNDIFGEYGKKYYHKALEMFKKLYNKKY